MTRRHWLVSAAAVAALAIGALLWHPIAQLLWPGPRALVAGGEGGGIARARPEDEQLDAAALERATRDSAAAGLRAFIVMRHNHIVFDRYGHGLNAQSLVDPGAFAGAVAGLLAGIAAQKDALPVSALYGFDPQRLQAAIEGAARRHYADYLSFRLWRPLQSADAWIALPGSGAAAPVDCCLHARLLDWMRIAGVLLDDGHFQGQQLVPLGWVARMRRPTNAAATEGFGVALPAAAHGAEPLMSDDVFFLRGRGHWRLWLLPSLKLAVLFGAESATPSPEVHGTAAVAWDETRLPNLVIRALSGAAASHAGGSALQQLVPGH